MDRYYVDWGVACAAWVRTASERAGAAAMYICIHMHGRLFSFVASIRQVVWSVGRSTMGYT